MVTKRKSTAAAKVFPRAHRSGDDVWLCNTVADCGEPAVQQAAYACAGCDDTRAEMQARIDRKRAELAQHEEIERQVMGAARDEERELSEIEKLHLQVVAMKRRDLGGDLELLEAAASAVNAEHTHPVFACAKHERLLQP